MPGNFRTTLMKLRAWTVKIWTAVTRHRFGRLADSSARQSRVQRLGPFPCAPPFDGDKSPAQSGEHSPHSTALRLRHQFVHVLLCVAFAACTHAAGPAPMTNRYEFRKDH